MFKWDKDSDVIVLGDKDDLLKQIAEVNRKGCRPVYKDEPMCPNYEPMYEEEHVNRAVLKYSFAGAWQDFFSILLHNGYEITARADDDEIEIVWKDKNDLVEEIKREARKIGERIEVK